MIGSAAMQVAFDLVLPKDFTENAGKTGNQWIIRLSHLVAAIGKKTAAVR